MTGRYNNIVSIILIMVITPNLCTYTTAVAMDSYRGKVDSMSDPADFNYRSKCYNDIINQFASCDDAEFTEKPRHRTESLFVL